MAKRSVENKRPRLESWQQTAEPSPTPTLSPSSASSANAAHYGDKRAGRVQAVSSFTPPASSPYQEHRPPLLVDGRLVQAPNYVASAHRTSTPSAMAAISASLALPSPVDAGQASMLAQLTPITFADPANARFSGQRASQTLLEPSTDASQSPSNSLHHQTPIQPAPVPESSLVNTEQSYTAASSPTFSPSQMRDGVANAPHPPVQLPPRRKVARATQACDACRERKARCDEGKPCSFCRETGTECMYREVRPPKQDRTLLQMQELLSKIFDLVQIGHTNTAMLQQQMLQQQQQYQQLHQQQQLQLQQMLQQQQQLQQTLQTQQNPVLQQQTPKSLDSLQNSPKGELAREVEEESPPPTPIPDSAPLPPSSPASAPSPPPMPARIVEEVRVVGQEAGEGALTIPINHTTAAHKLLRWPSVLRMINQHIPHMNPTAERYVMQTEEARGMLRLYGRGEGVDLDDGTHFTDPPPPTEGSVDASPIAPPPPALTPFNPSWGTGFAPANTETLRRPYESTGGLYPDGTLWLDPTQVQKLYASYIEHIHIMHPFMDEASLTTMIDQFTSQVNPNHPSPATSHQKRKRSSLHGRDPSWSIQPERSISTAVVLLVLALGQITAYKDWLPGPAAPENEEDLPWRHCDSADPSSPRSAGATRAHKPLNVDVIPGLGYFTYATEIIGSQLGAYNLASVQAGILASLYSGQMVRVLDSWRWIHWAAAGATILANPFVAQSETTDGLVARHDRDIKMDNRRKHLITCAYWTALQLESDLLAELDLPPSGITRYEGLMPYPRGSAWHLTDPLGNKPESQMWMFYCAQIALRRLLNRVHAYLYGENASASSLSINIVLELRAQLREWRRVLPDHLKWDDTEPPSTDINSARLRAKYYGALYIIHRPFLYHAIHLKDENGVEIEPHGDLVEACRSCIMAAFQSTIAFHNLKPRPILTNIFGTMHAQFGNMVVLNATYRSRFLGHLVERKRLTSLLRKTIKYLGYLAPNSPALRQDGEILMALQDSVVPEYIINPFTSLHG
ncbi:MAG: hypothetical protein M1829_003549 [Trizodia sp. TS-e1964]|nr:MAG: hypothetical protein M1829_003549 [Trizodia sp. TS-e1964]